MKLAYNQDTLFLILNNLYVHSLIFFEYFLVLFFFPLFLEIFCAFVNELRHCSQLLVTSGSCVEPK